MKSLELYEDQDGEIGKRIDTSKENMSLGVYDVSIGLDRKFWIRNPLHNALVDISDFHTTNQNSTFSGPDQIMPFETVRCSIKIPAVTEEEADNLPLEADHIDQLRGAVLTEEMVIVIDGKTRIYGDTKY